MTLRPLIVFDLDGTLIDSQRDLAAAANALIAERGGSPLSEAAIARMVGEGAALLVRRALTAAGLVVSADSVPRFLELYDARLLESTVLYPGIGAVVGELSSRAPIAVLTNKPLGPSRRLLDGLGLAPFVADVLGGDGPFPRKPDPAGLLHLVERFGASPEATVMVGDSRVDYATACAARTLVLVTRYGFGYQDFLENEVGQDSVPTVDRASDIPGVVASLIDGA